MEQRYDIIQQKIDNGTATTQEKQEQAKILALPYTAKSLGENLLSNSEEITDSISNVGKPGGFDAKGSSPEGLKNAQVFMGQLKGANNLTFVDGEAAFDINGKVYTESSVREFLNRDLGANVLGRIIPDEGPNFQAAHEFSLMPDPGGSTDPKKRVMNPAYLTGIQKREEDNGDITYYRTPNFDLLRQPGNPVGAELRADAESLLEMPGNSAVSMWNNTLDNKGTDWDYENVLTDEQKKQFVEAYVDYGLGANYFTQEIIERTEKAPKPKELTATEKKASEKLKVTTEQLDGIKNFPMEINVEEVAVVGDKGISAKFELINKLAQNMVKDIPGKSLKLKQIEGGDVEFLLGNVSMGTASIEDLTSEEVKKFVYKMYGGSPKEIGGLSGEVLPKVQKPFQEFARK